MRARRSMIPSSLLTISMFGALLVALQPYWTAIRPASISRPVAPPPAGASFEAIVQQAWKCRTRARLAAIRQMEALEEWDPGLAAGGSEWLRRELMARDADGDLRQSHALARQALERAHSAQEHGRAVALLARIECDRGHHAAELRWARLLMALAPEEERAQQTLRHAQVCLKLEPSAGE